MDLTDGNMVFFRDRRDNQGMRAIPLLVLMLFLTQPVHAYLDQGTGSMVVQIVAASIFGSVFFIKTFWQKTMRFCKSIISQKKEPSDA
jgi:hypothetical protein